MNVDETINEAGVAHKLTLAFVNAKEDSSHVTLSFDKVLSVFDPFVKRVTSDNHNISLKELDNFVQFLYDNKEYLTKNEILCIVSAIEVRKNLTQKCNTADFLRFLQETVDEDAQKAINLMQFISYVYRMKSYAENPPTLDKYRKYIQEDYFSFDPTIAIELIEMDCDDSGKHQSF